MPTAACTCGRQHDPLPVGELHLQVEALLLVRGSKALTAYALSQKQAIEMATAESLAKAGAYSDELLKTSLKHLDQAAKAVKAEILSLADLSQFAPDRQGGKLVQLTRLKALEKNLAAAGTRLKQDLTLAYQGMTGDMAKAGMEGTLAKLGALKAGSYQALDQAGREALADGAFSLFPADAFDFLSGYQLQLLGKLSDDLVAGIKGAVQVGIAQGEGPAKIARRIGGIVKDPEEFRAAGKTVFTTVRQRAELIARSETMRAYNQGALKFEAKIGVTKVVWLTAGDERLCPDCEPLDGKEYPLSNLPSQPFHPACRCTHVPGAGDLSQITDLATLEAKIAGDTLGQTVVVEALKSGDYGKLSSAQLREVAKEKGVSIGRTKAERITLLSKASGQGEEWLSGHTMNELDTWFKQYKIGALKSKDELLAALYKADHATDAAKLAAMKQAEEAAKQAKQAAEEAAAKLAKADQAVADFHTDLAKLKALEADPAQFEAFHQQMDQLLAQVHGNLELLGAQKAADLGGYLVKAQDVFTAAVAGTSQSVLREVLKAAKVKSFQWFTKPESVAYLTQKPLQPKIAEEVAAKVAAAKDAAKLKKVIPAPAPKTTAPTPAPTPKMTPVPAPAASPAVLARGADDAWAELKATNPFTFQRDASDLGGVHTKYFYTDKAGEKWLFKPISEEFRAWGDEVAYLIQREIDPDAIEVRFIELKDMHGRLRSGSIQKMKLGLRDPISFEKVDVAAIDPAELVQLQREQVVDWLISAPPATCCAVTLRSRGHMNGTHHLPLLALCVALGIGVLPQDARGQTYAVTFLGTLPNQLGATGMGVNNLGHVCGYSGSKAFYWTPEVGMMELPGLGPRINQVAYDLNNLDVVVGSSGIDFAGPQAMRAVRWNNGQVEDLGTLPGGTRSQGFGINDQGWVVGYGHYFQAGNEYWRPVLYRDGVGMDVLAGVTGGYAYDVNNLGQVVGYSSPGAFTWTVTDGAHYLPGPTGWTSSRAAAISGDGTWVAGSLINSSGSLVRMARWSAATGWEMFGAVNNAGFVSVNSAGDCVGGSSSISTGYVFSTTLGLHDVNDFIDPASGWVITSTTDINEAGQITGSGQNTITFEAGAVLLTPDGVGTPPPPIHDLTIRILNNSVLLEWSSTAGAVLYHVYGADTPGFIPAPNNLLLSTAVTRMLLPISRDVFFYNVVAESATP